MMGLKAWFEREFGAAETATVSNIAPLLNRLHALNLEAESVPADSAWQPVDPDPLEIQPDPPADPAPASAPKTPEKPSMSWLSNLGHSIVSALEGKGATPIVDNPTTPVEQAVNAAGEQAATAVATTGTTVATAAISAAQATVNDYLTTKVGAVGTEVADASLQALAATAIAKMSTSGNKTESAIAEGLGAFLADLTAAA